MKKPNPLLESLQSVLPAIAANAAKAEEMRMVPPESIEMLKGIGLHRAFQPKAYGGLEISCLNSPTASPRWPAPVPAPPGP